MDIDWDRLKAFELENIEALCRHFLPEGRKVGYEWRVADISGKLGSSLGVQLIGQRAGLWCDRNTGHKGNFHKLIAANRNCSEDEAIKLIEQASGISFHNGQRPCSSTNNYAAQNTP